MPFIDTGTFNLSGVDPMQQIVDINTISTEIITQELYDLMMFHDPLKLYIIYNSPDRRIYMGDILLQNDSYGSKYFVGIDFHTKEYVLYKNIKEGYQDRLVPLARYNTPALAFTALYNANSTISTEKLHRALYSSLMEYIDSNINIHEFIIGVICLFGYKDDPRLQNVISVSISFGTNIRKNDISELFRKELQHMSEYYANPLFKIFSDIYNIIVKYNFFKDNKYHGNNDNIDLRQPISDIIKLSITK